MQHRILCFAGIFLLYFLVGCGGGGGGSSSSRVRLQKRTIIAARNARAIIAITGLGRRGAARSAPAPANKRIEILLLALQRGRSPVQGYDEYTQLYYTVTLQDGGAGRQEFFTDAARAELAGDIVWPAAQWNNSEFGNYPVRFRQTYRIAKGEFAGNHGTMDAALDDATGNNALIHIENTNVFGETIRSDVEITDGKVRARGVVTTPDGDRWTEEDVVQEDGSIVTTIIFPDACRCKVTTNNDGGGSIIIYDPSGEPEANGKYDDDGNGEITYEDGTSDSVDVDEWSEDADDAIWDDIIWDDFFGDDGSEEEEDTEA